MLHSFTEVKLNILRTPTQIAFNIPFILFTLLFMKNKTNSTTILQKRCQIPT